MKNNGAPSETEFERMLERIGLTWRPNFSMVVFVSDFERGNRKEKRPFEIQRSQKKCQRQIN